jgi:uncharacterized membrane protein YphA (DoxX/SURF4 family)
MDKRRLITLFLFAARFAVGVVFIFASLDKIHDPDAFSQSILNYRIISSALAVSFAAAIMPWTELVAGFCLVLGIYKRGSSCLILVLLILFILAITQALLRNLDISCGCFTQDPQASKIGVRNILEDFILAILAFVTLTSSAPPNIPGSTGQEQ